jgi:S1-C subfamily serine protease
MDNSSSAAWSTTPTAPVDPETAAIVGLLTDSSPATAPKTKAPTAKKATKATKNPKAKDQKIASVSAAGTPAGAAVPATAAPSPAPSPADGATIIAKADVNAALGNFSALANAVRGSFSAGGAHLDAVAPDSLFAKAGLQAGDTITAINNQPLRSLDDAATLYSRAGSMKSATIQVTRNGKPVSLHLAIQ